MLRQENALDETTRYVPPPVPPAAPVGGTRVSTDELIAAVADIEARRDASQRWKADTIALGDAVQQLGLNMSPEELLAAIEDLRARRFAEAQERAMSHTRRRSKRGRFVFMSLLILTPLILIGFLLTSSREMARVAPPAMIATPATVIPSPAGLTLATLPAGTTAYTELPTLYEVNHGRPADQVEVNGLQDEWDQNLGIHRQLWGVRLLNGTPYIQGWGVKDANGLVTSLSSAPLEDGSQQTTFTLPVSDLGNLRDPARIVHVSGGRTIETIEFSQGKARSLHLDR